MWLVTSHAGCATVLSDARFSASLGQRERMRDDELPASMLTSDPPDHARLRGPGALLLGPAALRLAAGDIRAAARRVVAALDGREEADATADIGEPFAVEVFACLLTLAPGQKAAFAGLARRVSVNLDPLAGPAAGRAGAAAVEEFSAFMDEHVRALEATAVSCPLTRLAGDRRLTRGEMLGILSLAVVGGFLPLADLAGHAVYQIERAGRTLGSVRDALPHEEAPDKPGAAGGAARHQGAAPGDAMTSGGVVDELMRLATPIPFAARVTREAVDLAGTALPAGTRVLVLTAAANRDPAVFDHPDVFDPARSPNPHLAFGAGPHLCLGAPLVRLAGGLLLGELAARFPRLRQSGPAAWDKPLVPRRLRDQRLTLAP